MFEPRQALPVVGGSGLSFELWDPPLPDWQAADMTLPDLIPDWVLESPPLPDEPCACGREPEPAIEAGWSVPGVTWGEPPVVRRPDPSPAVAALMLAADRVCAVDPRRLSPEQALVDGEALLEVGQQLRVHDVRRLGDVRQRELFALAGHRSTASWLREAQPDGDPSMVGLATKLTACPALMASVDAGDCSLGSAKKVAQALLRCRPHVDQPDGLIDGQPAEEVVTAVVGHVVELVAGCLLGFNEQDPRFLDLLAATERIASSPDGQLQRLEAAFTLLAEQVPQSLLGGCLEDLVLAVLPTALEERGQRGREKAGLSLQPTQDGSGWHLEGDLDLECGERLFAALAAEARRDDQNAVDTATATELRAEGLDPYEPGTAAAPQARDWPRSKRKRLHDALNQLLARYLQSGLGGLTQKVPVQVNVTVQADVLAGSPGALPASGGSGARIPRSVLRRWWCDSRVTAYVLSRAGTALRVVHGSRTLSAIERRAALLEQRGRCAGSGCCHPGPDPTRDLRPHHVRRWVDDARTSLDETVLICDVLHRDLHEGGRTVRLRDGRYLNEQGWVSPALG